MIKFKNVSKEYSIGNDKVLALDSASMEIKSGEFTVILGPSGSGKSTTLNLLGGMDRPTNGVVEIDNQDISEFSDKKLTEYRRQNVGFVFQFYNLVSNLTAYENIGIAAKLTNNLSKVQDVIEQVGLEHRINNFPNQLSGGEMQRVAIARAVAKSPRLLLCDEPTGALDSVTGQKILKLLKDAASNKDTSVVVVTHNASIADIADQVVRLSDGHIVDVQHNDNPKNIDEVIW
jgi:putative ABC transport system ATP-binding protein